MLPAALEPSSMRAMAIRILCLRKMKRHTVTRKRMPLMMVKANQVCCSLRTSLMNSGVQLTYETRMSRIFLTDNHLHERY